MAKNLREVAEMAGVSTATVSRVFSRSPLVTSRTRDRVMQAAQRCNYHPHSAARAMRRGRFGRVACVVMRYGGKGTSHSTYTGYLDGATDELADRGYSAVFEPFHIDVRTKEFLEPPQLFSELAVDGIIGIDATGLVPDHVDERLAEMGSPVVWVNREPKPGVVCVNADEYGAARMLTRYVIEQGHRRIGYIGFVADHYAARDRYRGVLDELTEADLDTSALHLARSKWTYPGIARTVLVRIPRPTAAICYNRTVYDGALHVLAHEGARMPDDVALTYFASPWEVQYRSSFLTPMMEIPEILMAKRAVDILSELMAGGLPPDHATPIPGRLVTTDTTIPQDETLEPKR